MPIEDIRTFVFGIIIMILAIVGINIGVAVVENPVPIEILDNFGAFIFINAGLVLLLGGVWKSKTLITVGFILALCASGMLIPGLIFSIFYAPYDSASVAGAIVLLCFVGTGLVFAILSFISVQQE
ncbi:MAG: hypothetical protein ACFFCM_21185 [Promethearchaeota archaeon]